MPAELFVAQLHKKVLRPYKLTVVGLGLALIACGAGQVTDTIGVEAYREVHALCQRNLWEKLEAASSLEPPSSVSFISITQSEPLI